MTIAAILLLLLRVFGVVALLLCVWFVSLWFYGASGQPQSEDRQSSDRRLDPSATGPDRLAPVTGDKPDGRCKTPARISAPPTRTFQFDSDDHKNRVRREILSKLCKR